MAKAKKKKTPPPNVFPKNASPVCYAQSPEVREEYKETDDPRSKK